VTTAADCLLKATGLGKRFGQSTVLDNVDFSIQRGEKVCIVGPSGSGKTTLLRCLNLLVEPTFGTLQFHDELIGEWPSAHGPGHKVKLSTYRSKITMVFQHFELFPHLTALDNITLGPRHVLHMNRAAAEERGRALLMRVGLAQYSKAHPRTLSGGQKQRVAIARALAMEPDLILLDEPTSALDPEMVGEVLQLMASLAQDGLTMIIVTHELGFARSVADRIIVMEAGRILEQGPPDSLFDAPVSARVREILGSRLNK